MAIEFTDEQKLAIETLDKSVLVSAAAGSGKTAVLVERIIKIILDGGADVDRMLVVTFTKAAAAEMRVKLARAIKKRMQEDTSTRGELRKQLNKLYRAYISTFDSFAVRVIKEFFYVTGVEPNFTACDEIQSTLMQNDAIDTLFDEAFEQDDLIPGGSFRAFLRLYSGDRSEEAIKTEMLEAYSKLRTMPDYWDWAYRKAEKLNMSEADFAGSEIEGLIIREAADSLKAACTCLDEIQDLYNDAGIPEIFDRMLGTEADSIRKLASKAASGTLDDEFCRIISGVEFVNLQSYTAFFGKGEDDKKKTYTTFKTQITPIRKIYKKHVDDFRLAYIEPDLGVRIGELRDSYTYTVYFLNLLREFEQRYLAAKRDKHMMDFADMEHMAAEILKNDEAAETLRKRFKYIFIDEYQDTNNIQESLIRRIAGIDNVFKVGDVKQSIYRFRQAEPQIFEDTYREYKDPANTKATSIVLNRNFRSNDKTINYINCVFREIMDGYDEDAELHTGLNKGRGYQDEYDFIPEVHVLTTKSPDEEDGESTDAGKAAGDAMTETVDAAAAEFGETDDEIESISKEEGEAEYIADLVKGLLGTEFCDTEKKVIRKAEPRDIAVLFRSIKVRGELLARALREADIKAHIDDSSSYFDTVEVGVAMSLLRCIDNMKKDVPLIAVLHSEIFGWNAVQLAEVRIAHKKYLSECDTAGNKTADGAQNYRRHPYWEALAWYSENGSDKVIRTMALHAKGKILEWRELAKMLSLEDFVWRVLVDSGYYLYVGAMYSGERRQANLRALVDKAGKYSENSVVSLGTFISFLDIMKDKGVSSGQADMVGKDDNVVKITTIHKSKGLEYPFVIVGGLGHRFVRDANKKGFAFDSELGVGLHYVSPDRRYWRSTLLQRAITARSNELGYQEELRVLYVAMTRARNKLILVGATDDESKLTENSVRPGNYLKVLGKVLDTKYNRYCSTPLEVTRRPPAGRGIDDIIASRPQTLSAEAQKLYAEVDRRLNYVYSHAELLTAPAKLSVSAIRLETLAEEAQAELTGKTEAPIQAAAHAAAPALVAPDEAADSTMLGAADDEVVMLWRLADNRRKASSADLGIAYHRIMEYLDFARACGEDGSVDADYIEESAMYLRDSGAIDEEVFGRLRFNRIEDFFRSGLGRRAADASRAGSLRKEKPFTLRTMRQGKSVLVQGVIDCCWEENGSMVLVDYKSNFIRKDLPFESEAKRLTHEYAKQIELYVEAVRNGTGKGVGEAYLYLFDAGKVLPMLC